MCLLVNYNCDIRRSPCYDERAAAIIASHCVFCASTCSRLELFHLGERAEACAPSNTKITVFYKRRLSVSVAIMIPSNFRDIYTKLFIKSLFIQTKNMNLFPNIGRIQYVLPFCFLFSMPCCFSSKHILSKR